MRLRWPAGLFTDHAFDEQMRAYDDVEDMRRLDRIRQHNAIHAHPLVSSAPQDLRQGSIYSSWWDDRAGGDTDQVQLA